LKTKEVLGIGATVGLKILVHDKDVGKADETRHPREKHIRCCLKAPCDECIKARLDVVFFDTMAKMVEKGVKRFLREGH
jgi:L-cysteine desulfidase